MNRKSGLLYRLYILVWGKVSITLKSLVGLMRGIIVDKRGKLNDLVLGGISSKMVLFLFWSNAGTWI